MATREYRAWCLDQAERNHRFAQKGHLGAVADAVRHYREADALPRWLADELLRIVAEHARSSGWLKRVRRDMIDLVRAEMVEDAHTNENARLTWADAYAHTSLYLKGTDAEGSAETMRSSYRRVRRASKTEPWRYYLWSGSSRILEQWGLGGRRPDAATRDAESFAGDKRGKARPQRKPRRRSTTNV